MAEEGTGTDNSSKGLKDKVEQRWSKCREFLSSAVRWESAGRLALACVLPWVGTYVGLPGLQGESSITLFASFFPLVPPYVASTMIMFSMSLTVILPALLSLSAFLAVAVVTGEPGYVLLLVAGVAVLVSPELTGKKATFTKLFFFGFVAYSLVFFLSFYSLAFDGVLYGTPHGMLRNASCDLIDQGSRDVFDPPFIYRVAEMVCYGHLNVNEEEDVCTPWPSSNLTGTEYESLNDWFGEEEVCVALDGNYVFVIITPGLWVVRMVWSPVGGHGMSVAAGLFAQIAWFSLCAFVAYGFPMSRLAKDDVRSGVALMAADVGRKIEAFGKLVVAQEMDDAELQKIPDVIDMKGVRALESACTLLFLEPHFSDPGPFVFYVPEMLNVLAALSNIHKDVFFNTVLEKSRIQLSLEHKPECQRCQEVLHLASQLVMECAVAISCQPSSTLGGRFGVKIVSDRLRSKVAELDDLLPHLETLRRLLAMDGKTIIEQRDIAVGLNLHGCDMCCARAGLLAHAVITLLEAQSTRSARSFVKTVASLCTLIVVSYSKMVTTWVGFLSQLSSCCSSRKKHVEVGQSVWRASRLAQGTRVAVALIASVAILFFADPLRNWLLTPVGSLPTGKFGSWIVIPLFTCTMVATQSTWRKVVLRFFGTVLGVLAGYIGGLVSFQSLAGGAVVVTFFICTFVFVGIVPSSLGHGFFSKSWGYMFEVPIWTCIIVGVSAVFSCSKPGDADSLCKYSVGEMALMRFTSQMLGMALALFFAGWYLPEYLSPRVRGDLASVLVVQSVRIGLVTNSSSEDEQALESLASSRDLSLTLASDVVEEGSLLVELFPLDATLVPLQAVVQEMVVLTDLLITAHKAGWPGLEESLTAFASVLRSMGHVVKLHSQRPIVGDRSVRTCSSLPLVCHATCGSIPDKLRASAVGEYFVAVEAFIAAVTNFVVTKKSTGVSSTVDGLIFRVVHLTIDSKRLDALLGREHVPLPPEIQQGLANLQAQLKGIPQDKPIVVD